MKHTVIIGNGIAGVSAATSLREKDAGMKITLISKETRYFYSRTALMYIYMGHMTLKHTQPYEDHFWDEQQITLVQDTVTSIDYSNKSLKLEKASDLSYDTLILATGSVPNKFGWPGQDLNGVQGMFSYQDLELMEENTRSCKKAVIVGGGLIGVEVAEMLLSRKIEVTFLVRENLFWNNVLPAGEAEMISNHISEHHVDLQLGTELKEIVSDDNGRVKQVITSKDEMIDCQFVALTAGVRPNIDFLKSSELDIDRGIMIDQQFKTNLPDVYAIGDCAQFREPLPGRRPLEQVWYTGKMHGITVGKIICGDDIQYDPGIWFNSAKFFDVEYQTYGMVMPQPRSGESTFFWKDPEEHRSVRINYLADSKELVGFNFFGIRARHEICEKWIAENRTLEYALKNLGALNFDPEFFKRFEEEVISEYNKNNPPIELETKKGLQSSLWTKIWKLKKEKT